MVADDIGGRVAAPIDDLDRPVGPAGDADHRAIGGKGGVQRRKGSADRPLPRRLERTIGRAQPAAVLPGLGQGRDLDPGHRQIVRGGRVKAPVHKDKPHPVHVADQRQVHALIDGLRPRVRRVEGRRIGIAPVFIPRPRQADRPQARQRVRARRRSDAGRHRGGQRRQPCGQRVGGGHAPALDGRCLDRACAFRHRRPRPGCPRNRCARPRARVRDRRCARCGHPP